jgi:hypothetical protein
MVEKAGKFTRDKMNTPDMGERHGVLGVNTEFARFSSDITTVVLRNETFG